MVKGNDLNNNTNDNGKTLTRAEARRQARRSSLSWFVSVKYIFIRAWLLGIVKLFGLDGLYKFGVFFGTCEYLLQYKKRKRMYIRLAELFGKPLPIKQAREICRKQMCRIRCDKMIYTIMDRINRQALLDRFTIEGQEYMDQAIKHGKGTFFMFSHQGSHHLGGILLTLSGYPIIGLRDPNESPLRIYIQEQYEKSFPEFRDLQIMPSDSFARSFFKAFRENKIVAAAMDIWRDRGNVRTVKVKFFGQEREIMSGMTHIALKSQAAILVGFVLSMPNYNFKVIFQPWLNDPQTDTESEETIVRVMQEYAGIIENHVKKYPDHISKTN
jgi:lauroyl/myristoyl acyltransferase